MTDVVKGVASHPIAGHGGRRHRCTAPAPPVAQSPAAKTGYMHAAENNVSVAVAVFVLYFTLVSLGGVEWCWTVPCIGHIRSD